MLHKSTFYLLTYWPVGIKNLTKAISTAQSAPCFNDTWRYFETLLKTTQCFVDVGLNKLHITSQWSLDTATARHLSLSVANQWHTSSCTALRAGNVTMQWSQSVNNHVFKVSPQNWQAERFTTFQPHTSDLDYCSCTSRGHIWPKVASTYI